MEKPLEQPLESPTTFQPRVYTAPTRRTRRLGLLRKSPSAMIGVVILLFWVTMALFGSKLVAYGINDSDAGQVWKPPSARHIMGTDDIGRDIFSRLIIGSQTMVILPPLAVGIAVVLGTAIGLIT